jgi:hypothetical protein
MKIDAFFENPRLLSKEMQITPLLYGFVKNRMPLLGFECVGCTSKRVIPSGVTLS